MFARLSLSLSDAHDQLASKSRARCRQTTRVPALLEGADGLYDSVEVGILEREARATRFPLRHLALALLIHMDAFGMMFLLLKMAETNFLFYFWGPCSQKLQKSNP